uniref:acyltransferase family protein n=1 Tax=Microbulbifer agarilyticus TaxID=260552 RepID=UPI0002557F4B|nr:acyltransferase [Microbulbifer agarilyticus]
MFGLLRTTLALMVMIYHLSISITPLGTYAVYGFYVISGFLMTSIMHESYGYSSIGRIAFGVNRALRLLPLYWMAVMFSVLLIVFAGSEAVAAYHRSMQLPTTLKEVLANATMIFPAWSPFEIKTRLVPPSWALTVEIFFYVLICFGISKSFTRVKVWFAASVCYVIWSFAAGMPWTDRYFPIFAASLPFSIGSAIYFLSKDEGARERYSKLGLRSDLLFALMLCNCLAWILASKLMPGKYIEVGFYINIAICSLLVFGISSGHEIIKFKKGTDKILGDYSYPIYLLHWQCGFLVSYLIFGEAFHELSARGLASLACSLVFIAAVVFILIRVVDKPIQRVRSRVRSPREKPYSSAKLAT